MDIMGAGSFAYVDPYWPDVIVLAFNDNASNGTTTFLEQSGHHTLVSGGPSIAYSNTTAPTGMSTSALFPAINHDAITIESPNDSSLGSGDWCVDYYVYYNSVVAKHTTYDGRNLAGFTGGLLIQSLGTDLVVTYDALTVKLTMAGVLSTGSWHHHAMASSGGTVTFYLDGSSQGSFGTPSPLNNPNPAFLGQDSTILSVLDGYQCSLRITKGAARFTHNFAPPRLPLPTTA